MRRLLVCTMIGLTPGGCGTTTSPHYGTDAGSEADVRPDSVASVDAPVTIEDVIIAPRDAISDAHTGHGPPYPVVLHHGFAGFRSIGPLNYFYQVAQDLRGRGETVFESEVSPFNPPEVRAVELQHYVDTVLATTGSAKIVMIAHSQGGLDARYLITRLGYGDRVALLATVATPHRGTYFADAVLGNVPGISSAFIDGVATVLGFAYNAARTNADVQATLRGLSQAAAGEFNRLTPDDPRVVYWSWSGRSNQRRGDTQCSGARFANDPSAVDTTNTLLAPFAAFLEQGNADLHVNDGMVEVASARWGLWMGCVPADHFDEVGQIANSGVNSAGWSHAAFYRQIMTLAHGAGF
ncbi:MAG: triacylglycerol lipase [Deltaproteobacteria bacterium]